jgi:hypothetical protein
VKIAPFHICLNVTLIRVGMQVIGRNLEPEVRTYRC